MGQALEFAAEKADQRVYHLFKQRYRLFDSVFGVSDEVPGAVESGVDVVRCIAQVYQSCRTREEGVGRGGRVGPLFQQAGVSPDPVKVVPDST